MDDYFGKLQEYFQKTLEEDCLTNSKEAQKFEQALILLEEDRIKINNMFEQNDKLKSIFGFANHQLQIIQSESESEDTQINETMTINSSVSTDKESIEETVRIDKTAFPEMHPGYAVGRGPPNTGKKRKGPENPFPIPEKIESKFDTIFGQNILNLDCQKDRKNLIDRWAKEISLIIQTNEEKYNSQSTVLLLLDHKTIGSVNKLVKDTQWLPVLSPMEAFITVVDAIYMMFVGVDYSLSGEQERQKVKTEAQIALSKMQICDICYLEEFYCEYEKYFYDTGNQDGYKTYVIDYIRKIPLVGEKALARFNAEKHGLTEYSLAFAHKIVKEEIAKICDLTRKQKQLRSFSKKCCDKIIEKNFTYGCQPTYTRSKKKSFKRKYSFKKKRRTFKPGKYVVQKKTYKKKFCPKGKKNCRCWVCNEEGHYANECPNRQQHSNKAKMLEEIILLGLCPIEDKYDGIEEIYLVEIDPGETSLSESTSSDDESTDESTDSD